VRAQKRRTFISLVYLLQQIENIADMAILSTINLFNLREHPQIS
jgi:hypothetical protein